MQKHGYDMVIDWLAAGLDPRRRRSSSRRRLPEHAELFTLLAMSTPLGWLERVPTYKDQSEKLTDRDLATYGFLGYPLLQAADILIYQADVRAGRRGPGAARRAHARGGAPLQPPLRPRAGLRGQGEGGGEEAGQQEGALLNEQRKASRRAATPRRWSAAQALLDEQQNMPRGDRERLYG